MLKLLLTIFLSCVSVTAWAHGMSAEDQARILNAGYLEYIRLGATHMLTGYDHLLFLFGVMFFLTRFSEIIKFITAFTIGHSITLVFATLFGIGANYYLIDAVIALTVCYKAFDNLGGFQKHLKIKSPNLTWMVFAFGLIHGFGLSTRLQQLPLGEDDLVHKILSFNIGVEFGQIVALSIMLVLLMVWRKTASFERFSNASNMALIFVGGLLLLMQLHGFQHTQYPDDFPLNRDDHQHTHKDMRDSETPLSNYPKRLDLRAPPSKTKPKEPEVHRHEGGEPHSH